MKIISLLLCAYTGSAFEFSASSDFSSSFSSDDSTSSSQSSEPFVPMIRGTFLDDSFSGTFTIS